MGKKMETAANSLSDLGAALEAKKAAEKTAEKDELNTRSVGAGGVKDGKLDKSPVEESGKKAKEQEHNQEKEKERDEAIKRYFKGAEDHKSEKGGEKEIKGKKTETETKATTVDPYKRAKEPLIVEDIATIIIKQKEEERNRKRMEYVSEEYKANNSVSKIKNWLGIKYDSEKVDSVRANYNGYKIANIELLDLKLEYLKKKGLSGEKLKREMGNLVKEFGVDENINLIDAHNQSKARVIEEKFGKVPGSVMQGASKFINWYRKIGWKKKMIFSSALAFSGVGAAVLGANRIISGAAAGVGVTGALEARHRGKEKKEAEKKSAEFLQSIEAAEDKYSLLMEKVQMEIDGYDKKLKIEKNKARKRKLIGTAAAVFIGSGAFSHILGKTGATHLIMEKFGLETHSAHLGGETAVEQTAKTIDLPEIKSGGNIEASIKDYFNQNPDLIEKYNQANGGSKFNSGQIAHRLFLEYGDQKDLVHAGAKIHLSENGMSIESITGDNDMGYLPEDARHDLAENAAGAEIGAETQIGPEAQNIEDFRLDEASAEKVGDLDAKISDIQNEIHQLDRQIPETQTSTEGVSAYTNAADELAQRKEYLEQLIGRKQTIENNLNDLFFQRDIAYISSVRKYLAGGSVEAWNKIKDVSAENLINNKTSILHKFYEHIVNSSDDNAKNLKDYLKPRSFGEHQETVNEWVTRVIRTARKLGISKI